MRLCGNEHLSRELSEVFMVEFSPGVVVIARFNDTVFGKEYKIVGLARHL